MTTPETVAAKTKPPKETAPLNIVDMLDSAGIKTGRLVEFTGKRKLLKESFVDTKGVGVRLDFVNGQSRTFYVPETLREKFAAHGAEQKLGDEIAGVDDLDDCILAIDDLIDRLYNGEWAAKRDTNPMAGASILVKAMVEVSGKPLEAVRTYLAPLSNAQKLALRANKDIAPVVARLEAEKNAKKKPGVAIDTDALLGAFMSNESSGAPLGTVTDAPSAS